MAKVKNVSGSDLNILSLGRLALAGQVIEVDDRDVFGLTTSANWEPVDKAAKDAHAEGEKAQQERVEAQDRARHGLPATDVQDAGSDSAGDVDGGNASEQEGN